MKEDIVRHLAEFNTTPFLFVGSGLSRRYLGLDDWRGLLRHFAILVKETEFALELYEQQANVQKYKQGLNQKVAELIENDFNALWYTHPKFELSRATYGKLVIEDKISPFKLAVAEYINEKKSVIPQYKEEVELLKQVGERSISGAITTNYDLFLEECFEGYESYIGQEELLFSSLKGVGEIYKIHGSCEKPNSIIINEEDYEDFSSKNAYLAAKLLTIFIEHPVIFIGYSLDDSNIQNILKSIIHCLSQKQLNQLSRRLIFINWKSDNNEDKILPYSKTFDDGKVLEMTQIQLSDFSPLYHALIQNRSKYSTNILRKLKTDIYDLVLTSKPTGKMRVVGLEDDAKLEDIEVVVGVGVISEVGKRGYDAIKASEVFEDIVLDNGNFDHQLLVEHSIPNLLKQTNGSLPVYKYIKDYPQDVSKLFEKYMVNSYEDLLNKDIRKWKKNNKLPFDNIQEMTREWDEYRVLQFIPRLSQDKICVEELGTFLREFTLAHPNFLEEHLNGNDKTNYRRLVKIYDWLRYKN